MSLSRVQASAPTMLLIEPDRLLRATVAGVCRQLDLAQVHQAAHVSVALQTLQSQPFDLWLVSLAEGEVAIGLIERLRRGDFKSDSGVPVAVMASSAEASFVQRLRPLGIRRLMLHPFKIRDVVVTVEALTAGATAMG